MVIVYFLKPILTTMGKYGLTEQLNVTPVPLPDLVANKEQ